MIGIILAGGKGTRMAGVCPLPKPLLPVGGKPVITHIVDELRRHRIFRTYVVVSQDNRQEIKDALVSRYTEMDFTFVVQEEPSGPGHAIKEAMLKVAALEHPEDSVVVVCADTIFRVGELPRDAVLVAPAPNKETYGRWCYVVYDPVWGNVSHFEDKPQVLPKTRMVNIGVYTFNSVEDLYHATQRIRERLGEVQISQVLEEYGLQRMTAVQADWWDTGTPDEFMRTRRRLFVTRAFNQTTLKEGRVIKRSREREKLLDEYEWYRAQATRIPYNLPPDVAYNYEVGELSMGYVPYNTLADYYLFAPFPVERWGESLLDILTTVDAPTPGAGFSDLGGLVVGKTEQRVRKVVQPEPLKYFRQIEDQLTREVARWEPMQGHFHGDLCLGNILSNADGNDFVVIDPRGEKFGDRRYDAAKMLHSLYGYDHIINGLYTWEGTNVQVKPMLTPTQEQITNEVLRELGAHGFNVRELDVVVGCLFLSMLPLHSEDRDRQRAFFSLGRQILDEALA